MIILLIPKNRIILRYVLQHVLRQKFVKSNIYKFFSSTFKRKHQISTISSESSSVEVSEVSEEPAIEEVLYRIRKSRLVKRQLLQSQLFI